MCIHNQKKKTNFNFDKFLLNVITLLGTQGHRIRSTFYEIYINNTFIMCIIYINVKDRRADTMPM